MNSLITALSSSPATAFSLVATVLSLLVGVYPLIRRSKKQLTYTIQYERIVPELFNDSEDIEIIYSGMKVNSLSRAKVYLWNSGSIVIKRDDVAKNNRISIHCESGDYLFCYMASALDSSRSIKLVRPDSYINFIDFDFLNPNSGAVFEVIFDETHSGLVKLDGSIAGGEIKYLKYNSTKTSFLGKNIYVRFYFYLVSAVSGIMYPYFFLTELKAEYLLGSLFISPIYLYIAWLSLSGMPTSLPVPKELLSNLESNVPNENGR